MAAAGELIRPDWPAPRRVQAVATTRGGGISQGVFRSLNLGGHVADDPGAVHENRRRLARQLRLPVEPLWLNQVHGATVVCATGLAPMADPAATTGGAGPAPTADAVIARRGQSPGPVCAILTADCLPVLFCDESGTFIAAAHAGWRGLAGGVLEATVTALLDAGARAGQLMAWIGPAISGAAYEVGPEVRQAFMTADPAAEAGFRPNPRGRWQLDLSVLARQRLHRAGVARVHGGDLCTHADPGRFFSHRRDGPCGRQATLIWFSGLES